MGGEREKAPERPVLFSLCEAEVVDCKDRTWAGALIAQACGCVGPQPWALCGHVGVWRDCVLCLRVTSRLA